MIEVISNFPENIDHETRQMYVCVSLFCPVILYYLRELQYTFIDGCSIPRWVAKMFFQFLKRVMTGSLPRVFHGEKAINFVLHYLEERNDATYRSDNW